MPTRILILASATLCLLLGGCIEGDETIWLERDGSGRLQASYRMPPLLMARFGGPEALKTQLAQAAAADEFVDLTRIEHTREKGRVVFEFEGTFTDLRKLCTFPQRRLRDPATPDRPAQAEVLFGETTLEINELSMTMARTIDLTKTLPREINLRDSTFRYTVHLPVEVARTDAHTVSEDGRTLQWSFLLREHTDQPMRLYAQAPLPIPWWVWFSGTLLIIAFLAVLFLAVRRVILLRA